MSKYQAFLSYNKTDTMFAEPIRQALLAQGVRVFDPKQDLDPGSKYQREIEHALEDAKILLVLFSPNYIASKWSEYEFRAFQEKMYSEPGEGNTIIPLLVRDSSPEDLPRALRSYQAIEVETPDIEREKLDKIVQVTLKNLNMGKNHEEEEESDFALKKWIWRFVFLVIGLLSGILLTQVFL